MNISFNSQVNRQNQREGMKYLHHNLGLLRAFQFKLDIVSYHNINGSIHEIYVSCSYSLITVAKELQFV